MYRVFALMGRGVRVAHHAQAHVAPAPPSLPSAVVALPASADRARPGVVVLVSDAGRGLAGSLAVRYRRYRRSCNLSICLSFTLSQSAPGAVEIAWRMRLAIQHHNRPCAQANQQASRVRYAMPLPIKRDDQTDEHRR